MPTQSIIEPTKPSSGLSRVLPILAWLVADVLAGLTLWGLVVPEGMAYAGIADLPPEAGLYTLVAALFVYALFGSSRHLSVGATSATAALIASTVVAVGFTNLVSGLLGGMIGAGGMSASAVKEGAGARTQVANLVAWGATLITLLFLTPLFKSLPEAVLAALIIHAVWHVMTARKLRKIRQVSRTEFWLAALTLAGVLFIDVFEGMIIGVAASLLLIIYQSSKPHLASLGRTPGIPGAYSDLGRHPENIPGPRSADPAARRPLYYANALTARDQIKTTIANTQPPARALLLDAAGQDTLDITSAEVLKGFVKELKSKGIAVYLAQMHATVREAASREGLLALIGEDHIFPTVDSAVRTIEVSAPAGQNESNL